MLLHKTKLATPRQRLGAKAIDIAIQCAPLAALALTAFLFPSTDMATGEFTMTPELVRLTSLIAGLLTAWMLIHIVQWALIATRGQTFGKMAMKIQIVDEHNRKHVGLVRALFLRTWLNALMSGNLFYFLCDSLLLLRKDRKCLHDFVAKTVVIKH